MFLDRIPRCVVTSMVDLSCFVPMCHNSDSKAADSSRATFVKQKFVGWGSAHSHVQLYLSWIFTIPSVGRATEIFQLRWIHPTMDTNMQTRHACGWKGKTEMCILYCV